MLSAKAFSEAMPNGGHTGSQNGGVIIRAFDIIFTILLIILSPIVRCNYRNFVTSILMSEADYDIYTTYMTKSGIREILSDFNIIIKDCSGFAYYIMHPLLRYLTIRTINSKFDPLKKTGIFLNN